MDGTQATANGQDYVSIDDGGAFSYHPSVAALTSGFEYPEEVVCIVDRSGNYYRLVLDPARALALSGVHGQVDFAWLRDQWAESQRLFPGQYRIRRHYPNALAVLLADLFETLELELRIQDLGGSVDDHVQDPYGHTYRVVAHGQHGHRPVKAEALWYVEVERP
ncbi:hypothetical protein AAGW05_18050 [Arthrobacter sp. LAPM80]|uniref:hypothetical protein n=1 Tax=Arthrobacter sp. LAPM80 TaxID=3141788 RepID=UPI00398AE18A